MQIQYVGFHHVDNVREYTFHRVVHGEPTQVFVIGMNLARFRENHVGMQDGPVLCWRLLEAALSAPEPAAPMPPHYTVTDGDILEYLTSRAGPASKSKKRAAPRSPLPAAV